MQSTPTEKPTPKSTIEECATCHKPQDLCLCATIEPIATRHRVVILQHPQEPDKLLGSAAVAHRALSGSVLKVGLSWPNLAKIVGEKVESGKWGVLYLGAKDDRANPKPGVKAPVIRIANRQNTWISPEEAGLQGIVVLDGNWQQAKTLWWRNPWILKLKRIQLAPVKRSMYEELRREPRKDALSTLESIAETLDALGENPEVGEKLRGYFGELLKRYRAVYGKKKT